MNAQLTPRRNAERGLALIAVLVALGVLLGLAIPFLLSAGHGEASAIQRADTTQAELGSASVRDLLLDKAAASHVALDPTPAFDGAEEFANQLVLPETFAALGEKGRQLLAGETEDAQRRINLNTSSPLVLANLLGSTAHLTEDHESDAIRLMLDDASGLPQQGVVIVDREVIRYGRRSERELLDLERGLRLEEGYAGPHKLAKDLLVLDYRVVLAVTFPMFERPLSQQGGQRRDQRIPYASIQELTRLGALGFGAFTPEELDLFKRTCTVASMHEFGGLFGKAERVFEIMPGNLTLQVRSASFLAGGTIVRVRDLRAPERGGEFNLVWSVEAPQGPGTGTVNLPRKWFVNLLLPLRGEYQAIDTVVEPLLPQPVNVNTVSREVLVASLVNLRQGRRVRPADNLDPQAAEPPHGDQNNATEFGPPVSKARAAEIADQWLAVGGRGPEGMTLPDGVDAAGPYTGFEDFEKRAMKPLLAGASGPEIQQLIRVYQNVLSGRDGQLEMGTVPLSFSSAPVVTYRAAASRNRLAGQVAARHERQGTALVVPPRSLDLITATQEMFEEAFRLDRHAPYYTTFPINVGALLGGDRGTDPPSRHNAHLLADAYPQMGFGQARFPSQDGNGSGFKPAPATTPLLSRFAVHEDMAQSLDPEGRNVAKEGPYEMPNTGPQARGGQPQPRAGDHSRRSFPFTAGEGVASTAIGFWFRLEDTGPQALYDLAGDEAERDRIKLSIADGHLHLKIFDAAGVDPQGQGSLTSPELCAGQWKLPLQGEDGFNILAKTWYHVQVTAFGNRPGQFALLVDGVPRGEPEFRTYLTDILPIYNPQTGRPFVEDGARFVAIPVESTEGFPPVGVLRVGLELFEYVEKNDTTFYCVYRDSRGGRLARMDIAEFRPEIPVDAQGRPTVSIENLTGSASVDATPAHQKGAAVELYGYSIPLYRKSIWYPGTARLAESIGAFSVARAINERTPVTLQVLGGTLNLGVGLDETTTEDILLGNPQVDPRSNRPIQAEEKILAGFPQAGGYALLVQENYGRDQNNNPINVGGVEVIRYARRDKDKLTGIQRAVTLPTVNPDGVSGFNGKPRRFVCVWNPNWIVAGSQPQVPLYTLPQAQTYVVPISLPISGSLADPRTLGWTEWFQIYDKSDENKTEWVRYDVLDGQHALRARLSAFHAVRFAITNQVADYTGQGDARTGTGQMQRRDQPLVYAPPPDGMKNVGIGSHDQIEYDHPIIHQVRQALRFRGDWGTTCTAQSSSAVVLPVHRAELDWGNYGALSGRVGRNDRVTLVEGSVGAGGSVDWHDVNWTGRRFGYDDPAVTDPQAEKLGPHPFQLVGLKDTVRAAFTGPENRDDRLDARVIDRIVKFPSGELPASYPTQAFFGGGAHRDERPARGTVDELAVVSNRVPSLILDADLTVDAQELIVRDDATVASFGVIARQGVLNEMPRTGCMLLVDGELIACASANGGTIRIARNGRGKLGSTARAHDEGTLVHVLANIPVAILAGAVDTNSYQIATDGLGSFPRFGGTGLLGTEVLHYTWTRGDQLMEMPSYIDPESESRTPRGLFRGRYGTPVSSAQSGEPLIGIPFRYWDRYRERTDDPELGYFQTTVRQGSAYYTSLGWEEENEDAKLVDIQCLARVDGSAPFTADPTAIAGLYRFEAGSVDGRGNKIARQGDMLEARFHVLYRPGCFDPVTFLAHSWKYAPLVNAVVVSFEGEPRILEERVTAR